jgi:hypothetical protein
LKSIPALLTQASKNETKMQRVTDANSSTSCADSTIPSLAAMILKACQVGDVEKLRLWTSRGIRVHENEAVRSAVMYEQLHVLRYLIGELGADVHQVDEYGLTFLLVAVYGKRLGVMRCLVKELGADVNQSTLSAEGNRISPLIVAIDNNIWWV